MNSSSAMADHQHLMFSEIYLTRALCTHGIPTNTLAILYLGDSARIKKPAQNGVWAVLSNSFTSQILLKHYLHRAGLVQGYRENYMKILLLRSSQAGRKTRTKDENKAYHTRGGKWGLECKRHGPEGRAALLAEALQSHKCSWRTCWASMVTSMEKAQCTSQTWSLLSRAYSLANILTRNRKWKSTEACWAKGMWSALHEHRIKHEALVWKVNNKNSCKAMEPHYLHPPLSKPRQAGGGNLDSLCSSAASGAQVPKLLKSDLTWCGDTKIRQLLHDTVLNCRLNCFT